MMNQDDGCAKFCNNLVAFGDYTRHHCLCIFVLPRDCIAQGVDNNNPDRQPGLFASSLDRRNQTCCVALSEEVEITGGELESCRRDGGMLPLPCGEPVGQSLEAFAGNIDGQPARRLAAQPWLPSCHGAY